VQHNQNLGHVQLTEIIIVFTSNKWVALIRTGWFVVCVVD